MPFVIFWDWIKGPTKWWQKILYPVPWIAAVIPVAIAYANFHSKSKAGTAAEQDIFILLGAIVAAAAAVIKLVETYQSAKKTADTRTEVQKSTEKIQEQWVTGTSLLTGGINQLYSHFDPENMTRQTTQTGEMVIRHQLTTVAAMAKMMFPEAGNIRVNLCLPNRTGNLTVALYHQPDDSTHEGKSLPVNMVSPKPGAATAKKTMHDQYVANTHTPKGRLKTGFEAGRPYRSILSWVIKKPNSNHLIAIVNVDSPCAEGFGVMEDDTVRKLTRRIAEPALACIALALLDEGVLKHERDK